MGLDLHVYPIRYSNLDWWLGYNRLVLHRDYDIFTQIKLLSRLPVPKEYIFQYYDDEGVVKTHEDKYNDRLYYTSPNEFRKVELNEETNTWNKAVINFLKELPEDTAIVLFWS